MAGMDNATAEPWSDPSPTPPGRAQRIYDLAVFLRWFAATLPMALLIVLAGYVGALIGSVTFGALAEAAGIPVVWTIAGTVLAAAALLLLAVDRIRGARGAARAAQVPAA